MIKLAGISLLVLLPLPLIITERLHPLNEIVYDSARYKDIEIIKKAIKNDDYSKLPHNVMFIASLFIEFEFNYL